MVIFGGFGFRRPAARRSVVVLNPKGRGGSVVLHGQLSTVGTGCQPPCAAVRIGSFNPGAMGAVSGHGFRHSGRMFSRARSGPGLSCYFLQVEMPIGFLKARQVLGRWLPNFRRATFGSGLLAAGEALPYQKVLRPEAGGPRAAQRRWRRILTSCNRKLRFRRVCERTNSIVERTSTAPRRATAARVPNGARLFTVLFTVRRRGRGPVESCPALHGSGARPAAEKESCPGSSQARGPRALAHTHTHTHTHTHIP